VLVVFPRLRQRLDIAGCELECDDPFWCFCLQAPVSVELRGPWLSCALRTLMDCTRLRSSSGQAWRPGRKARIAVTAGEIMAVILIYIVLGLG
jgi:hypothetical protein